MFTLRKVSIDETNRPEKLRKVIIDQCGDSITKRNMEIGYFRQSKIFCIGVGTSKNCQCYAHCSSVPLNWTLQMTIKTSLAMLVN